MQLEAEIISFGLSNFNTKETAKPNVYKIYHILEETFQSPVD